MDHLPPLTIAVHPAKMRFSECIRTRQLDAASLMSF